MTDLRFEYKDGRVVAAVFDFPGPNDFRINLSGIDADELKRLQEIYEKTDPDKLRALDLAAMDGLSLAEKEMIAQEILNAMEKTGVDGRFSFENNGTEYTYSRATLLSVPLDKSGKAGNSSPADLGKEFQDSFEEATGIKIRGLDIGRNNISFSKDGKELRLNLAGLSEEEAHQLETHLLQNPELAKSFTDMLQAVGQDLRITDAERGLVNNNTEQLLAGAGVSADVVPESIVAVPVPGMKR